MGGKEGVVCGQPLSLLKELEKEGKPVTSGVQATVEESPGSPQTATSHYGDYN